MTNRATPISLVHHGTRALLVAGMLVLALGVLPTASLAAVPTGYFVPQVFSEFSSTSAGSLAGNVITVSTTGTFDEVAVTRGAYTPGSLAAGSGYPSPAPANSGLEWGSSSSTATVTFEFTTNPLTPACHVFVDDVDYDEFATLQFYGAGDVLLNPSGYLVNEISTAGLPSVDQTAAHIKFTGQGSGQSEPTHEIIPNVDTVRKIVVTGTNTTTGGGSIAVWFTCSQPPLAKAFNPSTILKNEATASTLTFTIDSINGNPLWQAGFTDTLPAGLQVANSPNISNICANGSSVTAASGSSSISFSGLTLPFNNSVGSCTVSVDVVNKPSQTNDSCAGNPVNFTNSASNVTTTTLNTSGMTPVCLRVILPTAVDLAGFWASSAGGQVLLTWVTVSEIDNLGFNLYRAETVDGARTRQNDVLIPARMPPGSPVGTAYEYIDGNIEPGVVYNYWLEAVDAQGQVETYGPVSAGLLTLAIDPGLWNLSTEVLESGE